MITPFDRIEQMAEAAADRHRGLLDIMRAQERDAVARPGALRPGSHAGLKRTLERLGDTHLALEEEVIDSAIAEIVELARMEADRQTGAAPAGAVHHVGDAIVVYAIEEIEAQLIRDAAQILRIHRKRGIEIEMRAIARGEPFDVALMGMRLEMGRQMDPVWFTDRSGRRIASHKHIRRFWGGFLREGYIGSLAYFFALSGQHSARIVHPDPQSRAFGQIVQLDGAKPDLSSYEDVFHPNAQATLVIERVYQEIYA